VQGRVRAVLLRGGLIASEGTLAPERTGRYLATES
jgi:hypothetical protein